MISTTDLADRLDEQLAVAEPWFGYHRGAEQCCGPMQTVNVFADTTPVREARAKKGRVAVLMVDSGGSHRCALHRSPTPSRTAGPASLGTHAFTMHARSVHCPGTPGP